MINLYNQKWIAWQKIYMGKNVEPYGWCAWPFILYSGKKEGISSAMRAHEAHHFAHQQRWLLYPFVYDVCYLFLWFRYGYWNHPWEVLARRAESE